MSDILRLENFGIRSGLKMVITVVSCSKRWKNVKENHTFNNKLVLINVKDNLLQTMYQALQKWDEKLAGKKCR